MYCNHFAMGLYLLICNHVNGQKNVPHGNTCSLNILTISFEGCTKHTRTKIKMDLSFMFLSVYMDSSLYNELVSHIPTFHQYGSTLIYMPR